ncbi:MAG: 3-hydroxyacyl-CoA dehydrogenase/enoyl-CoA hydratase family protein [Rhodocyclaceae bacterium]|nr:3-hydroxyacyl-CoA dehydrogenase/enoyl-CoA hydratase family protein [Rhodocyclaceae bacterium]
MSKFVVRKVAVLGAGVMGAQIAAHCANAEIPVLLFDLAAKEGDPNGIVQKALANLRKMEPSPLATADRAQYVAAANYDQHLAQLHSCDLVIEAIAERLDWKLDLYAKVAPHIRPNAIFASNTSGLSINKLADGCPDSLRPRFCGVHFFNPPRYMSLVELIPASATDPTLLDDLEQFLTTTLGKSVLRARDTPNFVANRVGVFSMLAVMHHTRAFGLGFDVVDALTGPAIGRAKSATYRTGDLVGLDTLAHVIRTMTDNLPDDPWFSYYATPDWLAALIAQGALGKKTGAGIYRRKGKAQEVLDLGLRDYRPADGKLDEGVAALLKIRNPAEKFAALHASAHPQAQFVWAIFRDIFHYVAYHLGDIAHNARDVDFAMRWGFAWDEGPFETWQRAGWRDIAAAISEDIAAGRAMASAPLPAWVAQQDGVHAPQGSFSAAAGRLQGRSRLPVYARQLFPERVAGEAEEAGSTIWESDAVRMWTLNDDDGKRVPILSFKTKKHTISGEVVAGVLEAIARAEADYDGLVIWQPKPPFSLGANLTEFGPSMAAGDLAALERAVVSFQRASLRIKYASVPVVAAVHNMALGGGCEFIMHCARVVAALESYIGLVEVGVGLIPAGGGCKEFALRAARAAARTVTRDPMNFLQPVFQSVAMAAVSKSAREAGQIGYMRPADVVVFHPQEVLHVARKTTLALVEGGWRPSLPPAGVPVAGRNGIATLEMLLANMRAGGMISDHDYKVSRGVATALCGGDIETGALVSEQWLLDVERAIFMDLLQTEKTQQRIVYMLENGKPLRN